MASTEAVLIVTDVLKELEQNHPDIVDAILESIDLSPEAYTDAIHALKEDLPW